MQQLLNSKSVYNLGAKGKNVAPVRSMIELMKQAAKEPSLVTKEMSQAAINEKMNAIQPKLSQAESRKAPSLK